jgi:hypothetical protein
MVLTTSAPAETTGSEAEALFKEARSRRRRRHFMIAAAVVAVAGLAVAGIAAFTSGSSGPPSSTARTKSPESLDGLATRGVSGSFYEVYQVQQGSMEGTVEIAQEASSGHWPGTTGPGKWSFVYREPNGYATQWIETGPTSWACVDPSGTDTWRCSGPRPFQNSNGFLLAIVPFIPLTVVDEIQQLRTTPAEHEKIFYYASSSHSFGPLRCLRVRGENFQPISACFDDHGILVSQDGGSFWSTITLLSYRSAAPASAFKLKAKSSGASGVLPFL